MALDVNAAAAIQASRPTSDKCQRKGRGAKVERRRPLPAGPERRQEKAKARARARARAKDGRSGHWAAGKHNSARAMIDCIMALRENWRRLGAIRRGPFIEAPLEFGFGAPRMGGGRVRAPDCGLCGALERAAGGTRQKLSSTCGCGAEEKKKKKER